MKKLLMMIVAIGIAVTTGQAFAGDMKYPYAPMPDYAQQQMQKLVDRVSAPAKDDVKSAAPHEPLASRSESIKKAHPHSKRHV